MTPEWLPIDIDSCSNTTPSESLEQDIRETIDRLYHRSIAAIQRKIDAHRRETTPIIVRVRKIEEDDKRRRLIAQLGYWALLESYQVQTAREKAEQMRERLTAAAEQWLAARADRAAPDVPNSPDSTADEPGPQS